MQEVGKGSNEDSFRGGLAVPGTPASDSLPILCRLSVMLSHMQDSSVTEPLPSPS